MLPGAFDPVWCGGMWSPIGRAHNVAISMLGNFKLPGDFLQAKDIGQEDIIDSEVEITPPGTNVFRKLLVSATP
jgi:hypothetical protein